MSAQPNDVTQLDPLPAIADVYQWIRGEALPDSDEPERRAWCLSPTHNDTGNPSCSYNVEKDTFNCFTCEEQGGVLKLVVVAGRAETNKAAIPELRKAGLMPERAKRNVWESASTIYQYADEDGALLYEIGRWVMPDGTKTFRQRVPTVGGKYNNRVGCMKGVRRVPYRLPELIKAVKAGEVIFVVEGEKDADNLARLGANVTTSAQGAKYHWPVEWVDFFSGAGAVYVLADNDDAGRAAAEHRAQLIARDVKNVKMLRALPDAAAKGDVSDWIDSGGSLAELLSIVEEHGEIAEPYKASYDLEAVPALVRDLSDIGAARWFVHHYADEAVYVTQPEAWFIYKDGVWSERPTAAQEKMIGAADRMRTAARDSGAEDFADFAEQMRARRNRSNALKDAQAIHNDDLASFDARPYLLNVASGTLDLRTMDQRDFDAADRLTMKSAVEYDPNATCPRFEEWIASCCRGDQELIDFMQMVAGSCLEGRPGSRAFYFLFGPKGTGKSTFIRLLEAILGPYQTATDFRALCESKWGADGAAATPHLAALKGKRLVTASESSSEMPLDAARVKQLVGGDTITARFLNQNPVSFRCEATMLFAGNEVPKIVGDESIWDKFKPVPFLHQIEVEDPLFEQNVLMPELSGILNWALAGLRRLQEAGYKLNDPKAVVEARNDEREAQDTFKDYLAERTVKDVNAYVRTSDLLADYVKWNIGAPRLDARKLQAAMRSHGLGEAVKKHGNKAYDGLRLRYAEERSEF